MTVNKVRTYDNDMIAKEGYPFIAGGIASSLLLYKKSKVLSILSAGFGLFSTYFFRNPNRIAPDMRNAVISAADGIIISKSNAYERYFFKKDVKRISVFMSLFNVHINRSPVDGKVIDTIYNKGKYLPAYREKASLDNEQNAFFIETEDRRRIVAVQIAGIIARRIVSYKNGGDDLRRGEMLGLIRFGSRVDIYIEDEFIDFVNMNEKVKAGETVLGVFK